METYTALSLNLWNRFGPWDARLSALRTGLVSLSPDIVGVQELVIAKDLDQAAELCRGAYEVAFGPAYVEGDVEVGNGIFSRFPILEHTTFALPTSDPGDRRVLLAARLATPWGTLNAFCTHLSWRLDEGHVREKQVRAVAELVEAYAPSRDGLSPVLMGDLNAEPDSDEIRFLRGLTSLGGRSVYFVDAFGVRGRGDGTTFSVRNPFAEPLREPERRIDYVFVRGHDDPMRHGDVIEARVVLDEPHEGVFPSDHFGVLATVRVR
jgi:endonuclease/exonuclease/phosphatase family metal-dependent hydrolase